MKIPTKLSIKRIHNTKAYDLLEAYCDDEQGGEMENAMMPDIMSRNQVVNLIVGQLKKEAKKGL